MRASSLPVSDSVRATVPVARTINALWNDLDRVATLRAEYRDIGEAGVLALARSDLLFARRSTARQDLKRPASGRIRDRRSQRGRGARCATPRHVFVPRHNPSDDALTEAIGAPICELVDAFGESRKPSRRLAPLLRSSQNEHLVAVGDRLQRAEWACRGLAVFRESPKCS
jgi:hypothetical protein